MPFSRGLVTARQKKIIITGGSGNLGTKLGTYLVSAGHSVQVLDPVAGPVDEIDYVIADTTKLGAWAECLDDADAVVHLAAVNPYPEATWDEISLSMDITNNVFLEAARRGVRRVVFSSSNHAMGGYKDTGGAFAVEGDPASKIYPSSPPLIGTKWDTGVPDTGFLDSTPYATAKLMGESLARNLGQLYDTSFVSVRIGWCQPGENRTDTMSVAGTPSLEASDATTTAPEYIGNPKYDPDIILDWYRNMWLSNPDFCQVFDKSIAVELPASYNGHAIVNGMSDNTGMRWDLEETKALLGYDPVSDARDDIAHFKNLGQ